MSMFRRRVRRPLWRSLRELLWPSSGWHRSGRYLVHRVRRLPGSPYSIAAGFACGAAVSCTPLFGLHFLLAALGAWLLRGSVLASAIGTVVGNPWTFPFILLWIYHLGNWIMGETSGGPPPEALTVAYAIDNPLQVLLPMLVGSVPTAAVVWLATFLAVRATIAGYRRARARRRLEGQMLPRRFERQLGERELG